MRSDNASMQVLGDQAVVDPSKIEALVMGQVARRKAQHDLRNQAAKLTPQEKRNKKRRKLLEDTSKELQVWNAALGYIVVWYTREDFEIRPVLYTKYYI